MSLSKRRLNSALPLAAIGALSFWLPDLLIEWLVRRSLIQAWWVPTLVLPTTFAAAYIFAGRRAEKKGIKHVGVAMLLGVWCTGGPFILFEWSLIGGPPLSGGVLNKLIVVVMSVLPPVSVFLSAYDGSLPGLLLLTVGAALFWGVRAGIAQIQLRRSLR
jgi:hypothetical protein